MHASESRSGSGNFPSIGWAFASTYEWVSAALLVSSYLFGGLMLGFQWLDGFVYLSSFHLIFSAVLLLGAHRPKLGKSLGLWIIACYLLGWVVEYIGVHGGWLFGDYVYGDVLGPKLRGIPLVIGVNWILVVYAVAASLNMLAPRLHVALKVLITATALVMMDVMIEPVAIGLDYWTWADGVPPLRNYLGWFVVGLLQAWIFFALLPFGENRLAPLLLVLQVLFFASLNFAY